MFMRSPRLDLEASLAVFFQFRSLFRGVLVLRSLKGFWVFLRAGSQDFGFKDTRFGVVLVLA